MKALVIPSSVDTNTIPDPRPQTKDELRKTLGLSPKVIDNMIRDGKLEVSTIINGVSYYNYTDKFYNMEL